MLPSSIRPGHLVALVLLLLAVGIWGLLGNSSSLPGTPVPPEAGAAQKARPCSSAGRPVGRSGREGARSALLCLINGQRRAVGLRGLAPSRQVRRAADRHASDMVRRRFFSHESPGGDTLVVRVRRTGYLRSARRYSLGEALGFKAGRRATPRGIFRQLMASPPHRAVLLNGSFRQIGVGVARGTPRGTRSGMTVTLDLGARS